MNDELRQQLDMALASLSENEQAPARFRVDAVLKEGATERTERVYLIDDPPKNAPGVANSREVASSAGNDSRADATEAASKLGQNAAQPAELGPFIRKTFFTAEAGTAYERLWRAQQNGEALPHLPRIFSCTRSENGCVVIMQHITGRTLSDEVRRKGASPQMAAWFFPQVCDAVAELHEKFAPPIIHRDIKPSNVMIAWDGAYLIDLGIARTFSDTAREDTLHMGTRAYAPPEQFGYSQTDERSDVYALGMLLYHLLTGKAPDPALAGGTFDEDGIPAALRTVLAKATAFDPANRYQSVHALESDFLTATQEPVPAESRDAETDAAMAPATDYAKPRTAAATAGNAKPRTAASSTADYANRQVNNRKAEEAPGKPPTALYPPAAKIAAALDEHRPSKAMNGSPTTARSPLSFIPKSVGFAVDALCVLWLFTLVVMAASLTLSPAEGSTLSALPPIARVLCNAGVAVLFATPIALVADRRPLYGFFPALRDIPLLKQIVAAIVVAVVSLLFVGVASVLPF